MNLDDFKSPWQQQQQQLGGRVDHVINAVRSRMSTFNRTIWLRDMRETLAAVGLFAYYSFCLFLPQNWLAKCGAGLGMLACIIIVAILYWARQKGKVARTDLPVEDYCVAELTRVDRQIWLLRNVHWWYLGPLFIAVAVQIAAIKQDPGGLILLLTFILPLFGFIYWLNRVAIRFQLLPLRHELASAIDIDDNNGLTGEANTSAISKKPPLREVLIAISALLLTSCVGVYLFDSVEVNDDAPKISPFTEVRFIDQQIIVTYEKKQYQWLELDGVKVEDIVTAAKRRYWGSWQKRVSEDLIDVLWGLGHQPLEKVQLRLRNLESGEDQVMEEVPMTRANRTAVKLNRQKIAELLDHTINRELRARLVGRYQLTPTFIFDVQDLDGHLLVGITNQSTQEVFPDSATRWSYRGVDATLEFRMGASGPATGLILHQNGIRQFATRIDE
jgi:hypothetical protein